ncbi:MAG: hypothetical protein AAGE89_14550 [Pseudomonadota bacterium]
MFIFIARAFFWIGLFVVLLPAPGGVTDTGVSTREFCKAHGDICGAVNDFADDTLRRSAATFVEQGGEAAAMRASEWLRKQGDG